MDKQREQYEDKNKEEIRKFNLEYGVFLVDTQVERKKW
jgi:hypothetical protein